MTSLFDDGTMEGFKKWLEHEDLTIRAFSALCIGNIARTGYFQLFELFQVCMYLKLN